MEKYFNMVKSSSFNEKSLNENNDSKVKCSNCPKNSLSSETEECVIFQQLDMFSQGFPLMEEIQTQEKLCDVTLKVDDQSFSGYRIVLASTIPYFFVMFMHDMIESKQRDVTIHGIDAVVLEALINFAYSGRVTINDNNVQSHGRCIISSAASCPVPISLKKDFILTSCFGIYDTLI